MEWKRRKSGEKRLAALKEKKFCVDVFKIHKISDNILKVSQKGNCIHLFSNYTSNMFFYEVVRGGEGEA